MGIRILKDTHDRRDENVEKDMCIECKFVKLTDEDLTSSRVD